MGRCKALREFFDFMAEQAGYCVERGGVLAFFLGIFDIIFCLCVFFFFAEIKNWRGIIHDWHLVFLHLLEQASCTNSLLEQIEQTWITERTR